MDNNKLKTKERKSEIVSAIWQNQKEKLNLSLVQLRNFIKSEIDSIEITKSQVIVHMSDKRKFYWDPNSYDSLPGLIRYGNMNQQLGNVMGKFLLPGDCVFDIGANFGWFSTVLSKQVGESGEVHCFEPLKNIANELKTNVELNNCINVKVNESAVGNIVGEEKLYYPVKKGGACASLRQHFKSLEYKVSTCQITTIDKYVSDNKINKIKLIKVDVEGAELLVLKGAKNILNSIDKPIVIIEVEDIWMDSFEYKRNDLQSLLKEYGYEFFYLNNYDKLNQIESIGCLIGSNLFCLSQLHITHFNNLLENN